MYSCQRITTSEEASTRDIPSCQMAAPFRSKVSQHRLSSGTLYILWLTLNTIVPLRALFVDGRDISTNLQTAPRVCLPCKFPQEISNFGTTLHAQIHAFIFPGTEPNYLVHSQEGSHCVLLMFFWVNLARSNQWPQDLQAPSVFSTSQHIEGSTKRTDRQTSIKTAKTNQYRSRCVHNFCPKTTYAH